MTIRKLADFIINEYAEGCGESREIAIDKLVLILKETLGYDGHGNRTVQVQIEDDV